MAIPELGKIHKTIAKNPVKEGLISYAKVVGTIKGLQALSKAIEIAEQVELEDILKLIKK